MAHENFSRDQQVEKSSDRTFGLVFAVLFALIGTWPMFAGAPPRVWAIPVAAVFGLIAMVKPALLAGLNRLWARLGVLLGKIMGPLATGVLFYAVFTPIGTVMRLTGKDPLRLTRDPAAKSYWIPRDPPGPPPDSLTDQF